MDQSIVITIGFSFFLIKEECTKKNILNFVPKPEDLRQKYQKFCFSLFYAPPCYSVHMGMYICTMYCCKAKIYLK